MTSNSVVGMVALPEAHGVYKTHVTNLTRPVWLVNARHPVVTPPVREQAWVVKPEDVDVLPVNEIVRHNTHISANVVRTHDTDTRWIVAFQRRDKLLCPTACHHLRVVVDTVEIVDVVDVCF